MKPSTFIKFDGVDGESMDEGFQGWIDVLEFSFGAEIPADTGWGGTGRTYGRGNPSNFTIKKYLDRATPALYFTTLIGRHLSKAEIVSTKASGGEALRFFTIEFTGVNLKSISTSGQHGAYTPIETVEFVFEEIEMIYHLQSDHGQGGVQPRLVWNVGKQGGSVM